MAMRNCEWRSGAAQRWITTNSVTPRRLEATFPPWQKLPPAVVHADVNFCSHLVLIPPPQLVQWQLQQQQQQQQQTLLHLLSLVFIHSKASSAQMSPNLSFIFQNYLQPKVRLGPDLPLALPDHGVINFRLFPLGGTPFSVSLFKPRDLGN